MIKDELFIAAKNRGLRGYRYDNSDYWLEYYSIKDKKRENERERRYASIILDRVGIGEKVLDAGCGMGFLTKELSNIGLDVTALDYFPRMLKMAKKRLGNKSNVRFVKADLSKLPFSNNEFSCLVEMSTIEHFPYHEIKMDVLPEAYRVIKPGGYLFVHVPVKSIFSLVVRWIRKYMIKDLPKWAIDDDADVTHKVWLSEKRYISLIEEAGFNHISSDYFLSRSNLKPIKLFEKMKKLQGYLDERSNIMLEESWNVGLKANIIDFLKSKLAMTSYMLFEKKK